MVLDKIRQLNSLVTTVGTTQTSIIPHSLSSALPYTRTAVQSNATRTVRFNSFVLQRWRMVSVKTKARSIDFYFITRNTYRGFPKRLEIKSQSKVSV